MLSWTSLFPNTERQREIAEMVGDVYEVEDNSLTATKTINGGKLSENLTPDNLWLLADSIAVYRSSVTGGPYEKIANVSSTQSSYTDSNVFALRDYYYVVNIFSEVGQSTYSNEAVGQVSDTLLTFSIEVPEASIPTIDGILSSGEWDDAFKVDISDIFGYGGGCTKRSGFSFYVLKI